MCGIFGVVSKSSVSPADLQLLATCSQQRGKDSSGLFLAGEDGYQLYRATKAITSLLNSVKPRKSPFVMGHSRLITNGLADNQPVYRDSVCVIHNGIVVNHESLWETVGKKRTQEIDTEIIAAIAARSLEDGKPVEEISKSVISRCKGVVACAVALPRLGRLCLFSNNGSLYLG